MKLFKRSKASNFIFEYFSKICRENSSSLKSDKNNGYFTGHQYTFLTFFLLYLARFVLELEIFHTKVVEEIKTRILCSITFF